MNMIRDPKSRLVSSFYYMLYDSSKSSESFNSKDLITVHGSEKLDVKCLYSPTCLKILNGICKRQLHYLGEKNVTDIMNDLTYEVIGINEEFTKTVELLECVYPTIFEDALTVYEGLPMIKKGSQAKLGISDSDLEEVIDGYCSEEMELYEATKARLLKRYERMVMDRGSCCREKRKGLGGGGA